MESKIAFDPNVLVNLVEPDHGENTTTINFSVLVKFLTYLARNQDDNNYTTINVNLNILSDLLKSNLRHNNTVVINPYDLVKILGYLSAQHEYNENSVITINDKSLFDLLKVNLSYIPTKTENPAITISTNTLTNIIEQFDSLAHRYDYETQYHRILHSEEAIPNDLKIPNILKYIRIDILSEDYTMDQIISILSELTDLEFNKCLTGLLYLDTWLGYRYKIGEIKAFFEYLKQRGFNPTESFLHHNSNVEELKERSNSYIENFVSIPDFDGVKIIDTPYFYENRDTTCNIILGVRTIFKNIFFVSTIPATLSVRLIKLADSGKSLSTEESVRSDLRHFIRVTSSMFPYPKYVAEKAKTTSLTLDFCLSGTEVSYSEDSIVLTFPEDDSNDNDNNNSVSIPIYFMNQIVAAIPSSYKIIKIFVFLFSYLNDFL